MANTHLSTHMATKRDTNHAAITAICNQRFNKRKELRTNEQPLVAEQLRAERPQPERPQPQPPHTGGTFHRRLQPLYTEKHKVSCSGFPPTSAMQHSCSHHNAFCSMTWLTRMYLRTWQHEMTTIVQPFHKICNHRFKKRIELRTHEQQLIAEHRGGTDWPRNNPYRNRRTQEVPFIAGCSHFTRKNTRFRAPASSLTQAPCDIPAAITMHFALQYDVANPHVSMHMATPDDNNHTAITAICNQRFNKRIELRTNEEPLVAEHRGGTDYVRNDPSRNRRTQEVPFIAGCSHFTQKNAKFALRLPPQHKRHATFMQPSQCILQHDVANPHVSTRMATPDDNNHNGSHYSNLQPEIQQANRTTHKWTATRCRKQRRTDWPRNDPNRNRRTQEVRYIAGCSHFTRKNTRFRAPASFPKQTPCNILAAITLRYFAVSHHPSLSVLLCGVKSHTTLHWVYCYIMSNLTPPFIELIAAWCKTSHHPLLSALLCDVKFHTTFHWVIVMWCKVSFPPFTR